MYIQGTSTWGYTMTKYPNYTGDDAYGEVGRTVFEQGEAPGGIRKKNFTTASGRGRGYDRAAGRGRSRMRGG